MHVTLGDEFKLMLKSHCRRSSEWNDFERLFGVDTHWKVNQFNMAKHFTIFAFCGWSKDLLKFLKSFVHKSIQPLTCFGVFIFRVLLDSPREYHQSELWFQSKLKWSAWWLRTKRTKRFYLELNSQQKILKPHSSVNSLNKFLSVS